MKYSFIVNHVTRIVDTKRFNTYEEWLELLNMIGEEIMEYDLQIEDAKDRRIRRKKMMSQSAWKKLNNDRYARQKQWRTVADNLILIYPDKINFAANQFLRIVREEHERIFEQVWPRAAVDPTKVRNSQEGRPKDAKSK